VTDYASAKKSDTKRYANYFHGMLSADLRRAVAVRAGFVSLAHTEAGPRPHDRRAKAVLPTL